MDNTNLAIKYILLSIILIGMVTNLDNKNRLIILYIICAYLFYINRDKLLTTNITTITNHKINEINFKNIQTIFQNILHLKEYNPTSFDECINNMIEFINIYNTIKLNASNTYQLLINAENLRDSTLTNLISINNNIPTKNNIKIENEFKQNCNKLKIITDKYLEELEDINNQKWLTNTNIYTSPYSIKDPKGYNYQIKSYLIL